MQELSSVPVGGIGVAEEADRTTVRLWGEIDEALRDDASRVLMRALERNLPVVLDAREITFIDSTGIAFLIQFCRLSGEDGLTVTLADPPPVVTDVLDMLGLRHMFDPQVPPLDDGTGAERSAGGEPATVG